MLRAVKIAKDFSFFFPIFYFHKECIIIDGKFSEESKEKLLRLPKNSPPPCPPEECKDSHENLLKETRILTSLLLLHSMMRAITESRLGQFFIG